MFIGIVLILIMYIFALFAGVALESNKAGGWLFYTIICIIIGFAIVLN